MIDKNSIIKSVSVLLFTCLMGIQTLTGQLSVAKNFTDHMVLQRNEPIRIWGKGIPYAAVTVQFGESIKKSKVLQDSTWQISFKKRKANINPQSIDIKSNTQKISINNVLLGDVWLCIGQSNMEWPMEKELHFNQELPNATNPLLRFYNPSYAGKDIYNESFSDSVLSRLNTTDFYRGKWVASDEQTLPKMSAIGYYFGKIIQEKENIPIGLINLAIGGAPLETFLRREAMEEDSRFSAKVYEPWLTNDALPIWIRERGQQNVGDLDVVYKDALGPNHAFKPSFAYEAGIAPITKLPIKGILWYQGESNAQELNRVQEYAALQKLMVEDYRKQWKNPKLPFYWVQLSAIDTANYKSHYWPQFRDEQRKLLKLLKHSGMAVSSDVGAKNDVHPTNKKIIGYRLAQWALNQNYGVKTTISGPLPKKAVYAKGKITIHFYHAKKGLITGKSEELKGFSLNGKEPVGAQIQGKTVEILSELKPKFIYCSWQPYALGNLENTEGLPASTFKIAVD